MWRSPKQIFNEADVSVPDEPQDGHLEHGWGRRRLGGRAGRLLTPHPHRLAAELLGELGQLGAGLVEPAVAVTAHPLCGLGRGLRDAGVHRGVEQVADAARDQLLLLAVLPCHILDLRTREQFLPRQEQFASVNGFCTGSLARPFLGEIVFTILQCQIIGLRLEHV